LLIGRLPDWRFAAAPTRAYLQIRDQPIGSITNSIIVNPEIINAEFSVRCHG
jgi:hypothetical protein